MTLIAVRPNIKNYLESLKTMLQALLKQCSSNAWGCRFITQKQKHNQRHTDCYTATVLARLICNLRA